MFVCYGCKFARDEKNVSCSTKVIYSKPTAMRNVIKNCYNAKHTINVIKL